MQYQEELYRVLKEIIVPDRRELYADCFTKKIVRGYLKNRKYLYCLKNLYL